MLDQLNGVVIKTNVLFDYEIQSAFTFDVSVTDGSTTITTTLNLSITDENDNAPSCTSEFYWGSIAENSADGMILTVCI